MSTKELVERTSDTPRTDAIAERVPDTCGLSEMATGYNCMLVHARQLERELLAKGDRAQGDAEVLCEIAVAAVKKSISDWCQSQIVPSHQGGGIAIESANNAYELVIGMLSAAPPVERDDKQRGKHMTDVHSSCGTEHDLSEQKGAGVEPSCEHERCVVAFDSAAASGKDEYWVRKHFPRFYGRCPDCGQQLIKYASFEHYIAGDW